MPGIQFFKSYFYNYRHKKQTSQYLLIELFNFRCGSYYAHMLMNIEENYHGMTEFFRTGGISAKAQTKHAIRTDQRGKQTIYRDAKSTGYSIQSGLHKNTANKYTKMAAYYGNGKCRKRMCLGAVGIKDTNNGSL